MPNRSAAPVPAGRSVQALSQQSLTCPTCHKATISAGRAAVYYPTIKVRCPVCKDRIRITLPKLAQLKFNFIWCATILTALLVLGLLLWIEPFENLEIAAARLSPDAWNFMGRALGPNSQPFAIGLLLLILCLVPILFMTRLAFKTTVHLILTDSQQQGSRLPETSVTEFLQQPGPHQ